MLNSHKTDGLNDLSFVSWSMNGFHAVDDYDGGIMDENPPNHKVRKQFSGLPVCFWSAKFGSHRSKCEVTRIHEVIDY